MGYQKQARCIEPATTQTPDTAGSAVPGADAAKAKTERILAAIRDLAPTIATRSAEIEAARRVPLDLVQKLQSIGVFRTFVPRSHGGLEFDLPEALSIVSAVGRIDGSVGWTVMIGTGSALFPTYLPRESYDQLYRAGSDVIIAGSATPAGTAEPAPGGWRVNGRWPFASGCKHANYMIALCVMTDGGKPLPAPGGDGAPQVEGILLPAHAWQIEDTWYTGGLEGTGSHHIVLKDAFVPAANSFDLVNGSACVPGPLYQAPLHLLPLLHSAFSVGMAEGALDDLVAMASNGRQQLRAAAPMRESEMFQGELGRVAADVRAARAFLQAQAASHWRHALAGTLRTEALLTEGTQAGSWIVATCVRAVDACFMLGGGSSVYDSSPLQRRLRDMHVAGQHAVVQQRHYPTAGRLLLDSAAGGANAAPGA